MPKVSFKEMVRIKKRKAAQEFVAQERLCNKKGVTCESKFMPSDSDGYCKKGNGVTS